MPHPWLGLIALDQNPNGPNQLARDVRLFRVPERMSIQGAARANYNDKTILDERKPI
jgi:hypothetical protein